MHSTLTSRQTTLVRHAAEHMEDPFRCTVLAKRAKTDVDVLAQELAESFGDTIHLFRANVMADLQTLPVMHLTTFVVVGPAALAESVDSSVFDIRQFTTRGDAAALVCCRHQRVEENDYHRDCSWPGCTASARRNYCDGHKFGRPVPPFVPRQVSAASPVAVSSTATSTSPPAHADIAPASAAMVASTASPPAHADTASASAVTGESAASPAALASVASLPCSATAGGGGVGDADPVAVCQLEGCQLPAVATGLCDDHQDMAEYRPPLPCAFSDSTRSLAHKFPSVARRFSTWNGFAATEITYGSTIKVWWWHTCDLGCGRTHHWPQLVKNATRQGLSCLYCNGNVEMCPCREYQSRCSQCHQVKPHAEFNQDSSSPDGTTSACGACSFTRRLLQSLRQRAEKHEENGLGPSDFDDEAYLKDMRTTRESRCYYVCVDLAETPHTPWQHSPQRLNRDNYSNRNTVPVCLEANTRISWTRPVAIVIFTSTPDPMSDEELEEFVQQLQPEERTSREAILDASGTRAQCLDCDEWGTLGLDFTGRNRTRCKSCQAQHRRTWRGLFMELARGAKHHARVRRDRGRTEQVCEITFEDIVDMFREQRGLCFYSGKRGASSGQWQMSLERRDVRLGYTRANCCLILAILQSTDHTAQLHSERAGNGGWSKEKFEEARAVFLERYESYYARTGPPSEGLEYA